MPSANTCNSVAKGKRQLIAIAGPSGSGKTTLARALAEALPGPVSLVPVDAYYADCSALSAAARKRYNFDSPAALDGELLCDHLGALAAGESVEMPLYDFASHSRQLQTKRVEATEFIIVEGLFALYFAALLSLYSQRIFVDLNDAMCLERRLVRDVAERGRSTRDIRRQYDEQVRPMYLRYIEPTRCRAQFFVAGDRRFDEQIQHLLAQFTKEK